MATGTERVLVGRVVDRSSESYSYFFFFVDNPSSNSFASCDTAFVMLSTY